MSGGDASLTPASVRAALSGTRFADVRWVAETGSTNADLVALAAAGAPEGLVVVADHQTAGRGRLGRTWTAPAGSSLLLSVLLRPSLPVGHAHSLTIAVALAARDACAEVAGVTPGLKWPNDLVVAVPAAGGSERKLAGVLAEATLAGDRLDAVVVGIGLNVNWPPALPADIADVAVALNHLAGRAVDRADLLTALLRGLDRRYSALAAPGGRAAQHREELEVSATLGRRVRVTRAHDELDGIAAGFTDDGALRLEVDTDVLVVPVGDVVHLRSGSSSVGAPSASGSSLPLPASASSGSSSVGAPSASGSSLPLPASGGQPQDADVAPESDRQTGAGHRQSRDAAP